MTVTMVMRRILRLEPKNRVKKPLQIERELLIAMELRGLDPHNTANLAIEKHLKDMNISIPQSDDSSVSVKA